MAPRRGRLTYNAESVLPPKPLAAAAGPSLPLDDRYLFTELPSNLAARVRARAAEVAPDDVFPSALEKVRRIEQYLRDPANFTYDPSPGAAGNVEPVENFLFENPRGHCEHFAAAMVVLLRCQGVPARLVTGFIGGEWNALGAYYIFRQSHAHAWVEAFLPGYGWLPFDPTPAAGTAEYAHPRRVLPWVRDTPDYLKKLWYDYVVGFDRQMQEVLARRIQKEGQHIRGQITDLVYAVFGRRLSEEMFGLRRPVDWLAGAIGGALGFFRRAPWAALLAMGAIGAGVVFLWRRWRQRTARASAAFYRRLLRLLQRRGFQRALSETPREFAARVHAAVGPPAGPVLRLTDHFCRVRYAAMPLSRPEEHEVEELLRRLRHQRWRRMTPTLTSAS
jgi:hypothetical protein